MPIEIELYDYPASPPCRAVKMTASVLGIKLKLHDIDLLNGKQLEPEFIKMNPFHKVPVIKDGGFLLYESNAILRYLVNKYAPDSSLYPKDPQKRAIVDQWLALSNGTILGAAGKILCTQLFAGKDPSEADIAEANEILGILDTKLSSQNFLTGDDITLADIAVTASLSEFEMGSFNMSGFPNVKQYIARMRSRLAPKYAEINDEPVAYFKKVVQETKQKLKDKK